MKKYNVWSDYWSKSSEDYYNTEQWQHPSINCGDLDDKIFATGEELIMKAFELFKKDEYYNTRIYKKITKEKVKIWGKKYLQDYVGITVEAILNDLKEKQLTKFGKNYQWL